MRIALISVDPEVKNYGLTKPMRTLGIRCLTAYARTHEDVRAACRFEHRDYILAEGEGMAGPCPETRRIAGELIDAAADVYAFKVAVWNHYHVVNLVRLLRAARPGVVVLGGGYQVLGRRVPPRLLDSEGLFDFLITGEGEVPFVHFVRGLLGTERLEEGPALWLRDANGRPFLTSGEVKPDVARIPSTFDAGVEEDLEGRLVILETSRGCPFQCEFCEWADTRARYYPLPHVLAEIDHVLDRGASRIWYADGTFNLDRPGRFHPILEHVLVALERCRGRFGERFLDGCSISLELRPEIVTERCAELLERLAATARGTTFDFGLQTTGELPGRLSGRPFRREKWMTALARLGPISRRRTSISLILDLPGQTTADLADTFRTYLQTGAGSVSAYRLQVLPGTRFEERSEALGLEYDPMPPHRPRRWLGRSDEEMARLYGFAMLCQAMTTLYRPLWEDLEAIGAPDLHLASVLTRFEAWLETEGALDEFYGRCRRVVAVVSEKDAEIPAFRSWAVENLPRLFERFAVGLAAGHDLSETDRRRIEERLAALSAERLRGASSGFATPSPQPPSEEVDFMDLLLGPIGAKLADVSGN